jgi:tripartite-type tricarboxylate transporter receptor subunit TctC
MIPKETTMKRLSLMLVAIAAFAMLPALTAFAEWTPGGPIKLLVAFRAGGGTDTQARMIAEELEARKGWKIIPGNVTGKGGAVLAKKIKDEPNDGLTIGMAVTETFSYGMIAAKNPGYSADDFTYLTTTTGSQMGVVAMTGNGWKNFDDVVAATKGGKQMRFGVMSPKLADGAYLLGKQYGVDFNIVMLKGGKGVMNALNAGDIDIGWGAGIQTKAVLAGDMINLLSGETTRLHISPDAPTMTEIGVPYDFGAKFVFFAPAGIPEEARTTLSSAIGEIINDKSTKASQFVTKAFSGPLVIAGDELTRHIKGKITASRELMAASE